MSMNKELEDQQSLSQIYNVLHNSFHLTSDLQAVVVKISLENTITIGSVVTARYKEGSVFLRFNGPKYRWSEVALVRRSFLSMNMKIE